jgi:hypothetical protein
MRLNQFTNETRRLHDLARKEAIRMAWLGHAEKEMRADGISKLNRDQFETDSFGRQLG